MSRAYEQRGKRIVDVVGASIGLAALSPVFVVVGMAIRLTSRGPVIYRQPRVGADSTPFTLFKFRSMPTDTPVVTSAEAAALQPTAVGSVIRRLNIDELPQLVNILRGDMSIVGPRPALTTQTDLLDRRTPNGSARLRPGLTGLAQINSFEGMLPSEKARWDEQYAADVSLGRDVRIVAATFRYLAKPPPRY